MRAASVRAAIISAIEGCELDTKASRRDVFAVLSAAREPEQVRERVAMVRLLSGPDKTDSNTCDAFVVTYQIVRYYAPSDDIEDRMAADTERLYLALSAARLIAAEPDIMDVTLGPTSVDEGALIAARQDVTVLFRLDSSLLGD